MLGDLYWVTPEMGRPFRRSIPPDLSCPAKGADIDFFQNGSEDLTL